MKKLIYLLLLPLVVAVTACGGKVNSKKESVLATQDSVDARGIQRMQTSKSEIDIKFKGKDYRSFVSRTPDESLPHVTNEMGDTYMDNKIVLRLTRGGESVFNKTFTKNDFSSVVDADFLAKSVLEGIVYDKTTPQGIVYAAEKGCLSYFCTVDKFAVLFLFVYRGLKVKEHKKKTVLRLFPNLS